MLSKNLEQTLHEAVIVAQREHHEYLTLEHLLLALLYNSDVQNLLEAFAIDRHGLEQDLLHFIKENASVIREGQTRETQPTIAFQRVLQRALYHMESSHRKEVLGTHVLVAIFAEQESHAVCLLERYQLDRLSVMHYLSHGLTGTESESESLDSPETEHSNHESQPAIAQFTVNLNKKVLAGKIDPLIGRQQEMQALIQTLARRRKNNPLLVGEAGVGKTALAEGLAYRIVHRELPSFLFDYQIYSLDIGALLAGTKYCGDFEKRFKMVLKELMQTPHNLLFIDEIHSIIGAGATSSGQIDVANLLKPLLVTGELRVLGATTYQEYRTIFDKDRALSRRFQKIEVLEPTASETLAIINGLKKYYEQYHKVSYSKAALQAIVDLSIKYLPERFLPDKAIDIVDEVGASNRLLPQKQRKKIIQVSDIERVISKMARIPAQHINTNDKLVLQTLAENLKQQVFGQDQAIEALTHVIKIRRAGLTQERGLIGSFLFAGPTGVGKTEFALQLAKLLKIELLRFDMSEYGEAHTISRLIGAPPGYVGYEQAGLLTNAVMKHPYAVLLLDELEKAHSDIFNLLLQVMDHGSLTDSSGRQINFKHTILIMTTNAGATDKSSIGFLQHTQYKHNAEEITRVFSPEFRNRLDHTILFNGLNSERVRLIAEKFIMQLKMLLKSKKVCLQLDEAAIDLLVTQGYQTELGARPMARVIDSQLKRPIADEILFGTLFNGGVVKVGVDATATTFLLDYTAA